MYYTLVFLLLIPEIFFNLTFIVFIIIYYAEGMVDTFIRPAAKKAHDNDKYAKILGLMFILNPFFIVLTYFEYKFLLSPFLLIWNNPIFMYIGLGIFLIGSAILLISRIQLGRFATGDLVIEEDHELITAGIYGRVRHPIYLGGLIGGIGFGLMFRGLFMVLLYFILN